MVVRDFAETETASFWYAGQPGQIRRAAPARHQDRGVSDAGGIGRRKGRHLHQYAPARAMARQDRRAAGRQPLGNLVHVPPRASPQGALRGQHRPQRTRRSMRSTWDYPTTGASEEPSVEAVLKEINGYTWPDRRQIAGFQDRRTTARPPAACGPIPASSPRTTTTGRARVARMGPDGPGTHLGWGFAWPANRRTLYNRAAADPQGRPWSEQKKLVWWDEGARRWNGHDASISSERSGPITSPTGRSSRRGWRRSTAARRSR